MINNDQVESLSVISSGSNSSYNSSSASSTSSSSSSCNSSQMSTTPTNDSSQSQSSSPNSSLSLSSALSPNYYRQVSLNTSNYEQIACDFNNIMGDLTNVCGTLNILAKQIDQIVHKIDDKFTFILEGLSQNDSEMNHHCTNKTNDHQNAEIIKDFKKMNEKNLSLLHNTVKQNAQNCDKIDSLKHCRTLPASTKPCRNSNCMNNTNANKTVNNNHNIGNMFIDHKSYHCSKNNSNISVCSVVNSDNKTSQFTRNGTKSNNESVLMNIIKTDYNGSTSNNTDSLSRDVSARSASERKPCLKSYSNAEKSADSYHRYNTLTNTESEKTLRSKNKSDFWSPLDNKSATCRNYEAAQRFLENQASIERALSANNNNTSSLRRCTRSKSQPAFNKHDNLHLGSISHHQNELHKNICPIITHNSGSANAFAQNSMFDFKTKDDLVIDRKNHESAQCHESSFYEDQLDNELENIDSPGSSQEGTSPPKFSNESKPLKTNSEILTSPTRKVAFDDSCLGPKPASNTRKQSKSNNSNHHVSFNINNAIYTTRQEIPISIIKGAANSQSGSPSSTNSVLNKSGVPIQSSLKKSTTSHTIQQTNNEQGGKDLDTVSSESAGSKINRFFNGNKSRATADTKTTIL